jgi:16S rRNA (uracil1498-N3)-methyltransferase
MNLLLFNEPFETCRIPFVSERGKHLRDVLKVTSGASLYVGFVDGARALCQVEEVTEIDLLLRVQRVDPSPSLLPLALCVALPRPHSARKLLYDAAMMGVGELVFFSGERCDASYRNSRLWQTDEWRQRIYSGLEQSFCTIAPIVRHFDHLNDVLEFFMARNIAALDNYEASAELSDWLLAQRPQRVSSWTLLIGPERGFTAAERSLMRAQEIPLLHLGPRVLRVETAAVVATALVGSLGGYWA